MEKTTLRCFLRRRLIYYIIPNVLFNGIIAYASFNELGYTYFFEGPQSLARLILPMALFLPVILTVDILKRVIAAAEQGLLEFVVKRELNKNKFMAKMGIIHGIVTGILVLLGLITAQFLLPAHHKLDVVPMVILDSGLAGVLSVLFTYLPVKKLRRYLI